MKPTPPPPPPSSNPQAAMAGIRFVSQDEWATLSSHGPPSSEPNPYLSAHFTSHFRLLDLERDILRKVLDHAMPSYDWTTNPLRALIHAPRKCRQNSASRPPPTALMQTCKKVGACARALWLEGLFHLYVASWTKLEENKGILKNVAGMRDICVTLDIRAGTRSRVASGQEGKLRATSFGRQIRALVAAMQPGHGLRVQRLMLKVTVGLYATTFVVKTIMEAWRQLRVGRGVKMDFVINYEEPLRNPHGETRPGIPSVKFVRQLVADMSGSNVADLAPCRVAKRRKDKKIFELHASSLAVGKTHFKCVRRNKVGGPQGAGKEGAEIGGAEKEDAEKEDAEQEDAEKEDAEKQDSEKEVAEKEDAEEEGANDPELQDEARA